MVTLGKTIKNMTVIAVNPLKVRITEERVLNKEIPEIVRLARGTLKISQEEHIIVAPFGMGKYPVTNLQYEFYLRVNGYSIPNKVSNKALADHPVVEVNIKDAKGYCSFLDSFLGRVFRLPTDEEWMIAAKGKYDNRFPWGNELTSYHRHKEYVNFNSKGTTPVDAHPRGATDTGIFDMAGNVYEMCTWGKELVAYGGSWKSKEAYDLITQNSRGTTYGDFWQDDFGFRVVELLPKTP